MALRTESKNPRRSDFGYFVVRCLGFKDRKFFPGQKLTVGRHSSNDIVLANIVVSRFHAEIVWRDFEDRPYIEDHSSANGIDLDGRRVEVRSYLTGKNNQIEIGDYVLVAALRGQSIKRSRSGRFANLPAKTEPKSEAVRLYSEKAVGLREQFDSADELRSILLGVESDERTGTLLIRAQGFLWSISFAQGRIVNARFGSYEGLNALHRLLPHEKGTFRFTRDIEPSDMNLNLSTNLFLRDAAGNLVRKTTRICANRPR